MTPTIWFDLVVVLILAFTAYRGAAKGLIWQLAWIAALILCFTLSGSTSPVLAAAIPVEAPLNRWIAMFLIYVASVFVTFWLARQISDWMEKHRFKELDKHFGAIFGVTKGVIFSLTLTFFLVTLSAEARGVVLKSKSGYVAALIMDRLHPVMSDEFHDALEPYIHQLDDAAGETPLLHSHDDDDDADPANRNPAAKQKKTTSITNRASGPAEAGASGISRSGVVPAEIPGSGGKGNLKRRDLLTRIAALHSVDPSAQVAMVNEIDASLTGLPDEVSVAVLADWLADLTDSRPDPNPKSDASTDLDTRIRFQLEDARIPLNRLDAALRDRLEGPRR